MTARDDAARIVPQAVQCTVCGALCSSMDRFNEHYDEHHAAADEEDELEADEED